MLPQSASTLLIAAGLAGALFLLLRRKPVTGLPERSAFPRDHSAPAFLRLHPSSPAADRQPCEAHDTPREPNGQVADQLAVLQNLIAVARRESERLEAALRRAEQLNLSPAAAAGAPNPPHSLARIESLADPAALADPNSLALAASSLASPAGESLPPIDPDLFDSNRRTLELARLADQGLSPTDIARRLGLPLGEVELLLSLRPA